MEYAGFSLFDQYQIFDYKFVKRTDNGAVMLVAVPLAFNDAKQACVAVAEGEKCSIGRTSGKCYGGLCTQGIGPLGRLSPQCRGYATPEAPFGFTGNQIEWETPEFQTTAKVKSFGVSGFDRANICQQGNTCQCTYQKITYGDGNLVRFFDENWNPDVNLPRGFCQGGFTADSTSKTGRLCTSSVKCGDERELADPDRDRRDGECIFRTQVSKHRGWQGVCLENDGSIRTPGSGVNNRPCLTWMPLDNPPGLESLNNAEEAGYITAGQPIYYCAQSQGNMPDWRGRECKDGDFQVIESVERGVRRVVEQFVCTELFPASTYSYLKAWHMLRGYSGDNIVLRREFLPINADTPILLSDVDYIEIEFKPLGNNMPDNGTIRIVNNIDPNDQAEGIIGKPHIYAGSVAQCAWIAYAVSVPNQNSTELQNNASQLYDCTIWGQNGTPSPGNSSRGVSVVSRSNGSTYFSFIYNDGDENGAASPTCGNTGDGRTIAGRKVLDCWTLSNAVPGPLHNPAVVFNQNNADPGKGGWIRYGFSANGQLSQDAITVTISRNQNETSLRAVGRVYLREICKEVAGVTDARSNAAWTNKLWSQGPND